MTEQGGPYTIFRRALERGSLVGVRAAVPNLPAAPPLEDALVICRLLLEQEPDRYERGGQVARAAVARAARREPAPR